MDHFVTLIAGGVLTLAGSFAAKIFDECRQARALRRAFRAEIKGLFFIAEVRKHLEVAESYVAAWKAGRHVQFTSFGFEQASRDPVFTANVDHIGSIGRRLAEEVIEFYVQLLAVRITIQSFDDPRMQAATPAEKAAHAEAAIKIWRQAKAKGAALVDALEARTL